MMTTTYRHVVEQLLAAIARYQGHEIDLDQLKAAIWDGSRTIASSEERMLREQLQSVEGKLDMIQFTFEQQEIEARAAEIVTGLERRLRDARSPLA